jgi:hypothetical protein
MDNFDFKQKKNGGFYFIKKQKNKDIYTFLDSFITPNHEKVNKDFSILNYLRRISQIPVRHVDGTFFHRDKKYFLMTAEEFHKVYTEETLNTLLCIQRYSPQYVLKRKTNNLFSSDYEKIYIIAVDFDEKIIRYEMYIKKETFNDFYDLVKKSFCLDEDISPDTRPCIKPEIKVVRITKEGGTIYGYLYGFIENIERFILLNDIPYIQY